MAAIELVVLDMAGTTVTDKNEVEDCFWQAAHLTGIKTTRERILSMMGWSKILVFETLWREQLGGGDDDLIRPQVENSYQLFTKILETHYLTCEVTPTEGCLELIHYLNQRHIKIALNTGFYRKVADIILRRLRWDIRMDSNIPGAAFIDASVSSDQVIMGRPAPFMIFRAMEICRVADVRKVIKIGDTPSDLAEGKNAGVLSLGVVNGTHTREQLNTYENDGLMDNLFMFRSYLENCC